MQQSSRVGIGNGRLGTITPNGLHFVVARTGFPDIDPAKHRLVIYGLVKQPLMFDLDTLARYPMVTRFLALGLSL